MMMNGSFKRLLAPAGAILAASTALAQYDCVNITPGGGTPDPAPQCLSHTGAQVTVSGATLFRTFFELGPATNDWVDVDSDGCFGYNDPPSAPCSPLRLDSLAPANNYNSTWVFQYRGVGSVAGFGEFVTFHICCDLPEVTPTERSFINSVEYWNGSAAIGTFPCRCTGDLDGDGIPNGIGGDGTPQPNGTGTPICPAAIDLAVLDVPSLWAVRIPGDARWNRNPTAAGYGENSRLSAPLSGACIRPGPETYHLESLSRDCSSRELNFNTTSPDEDTVFDTPLAFVAVVPISNRGTGLETVTYSQMQHHFVTGRLPSGENLAASTRDVGSGTHNAWMNSIGIDPSFGVGDARGGRSDSSSRTNLGPCHRVTNCGSSSHQQNGVQQRRIAFGYTGISGTNAAAVEAFNGRYEVLNVINDVAGGNGIVRPTVSSILDNDNVNTGYQIGGYVSFTSVGDPQVSSPKSPAYDPLAPEFMANTHAADFLYNITKSIADFTCAGCTTLAQNELMPGQFLAIGFFLADGQDAAQNLFEPQQFTAYTPGTPIGSPADDDAKNPALQQFIRDNNDLASNGALPSDGVAMPAYGSRNEAGLVPNRTQGAYSYRDAGGAAVSIGSGQRLSIRNRIAGDFAYNGRRDLNDIGPMLDAFVAGAANYTEAGAPLPTPGGMFDDPSLTNNDGQGHNTIIVDIIGDLDGSGVFDAEDVRYYADGLVITSGKLNRCAAFSRVDSEWTVGQAGRPAGNFFNTSIVRPNSVAVAYTAGASRFDVTGSATGPARGDAPIGANGTVDIGDYVYIWDQSGDWSSLDQAVQMDLSADMNGDLVIDQADAKALYECGWGVPFGDINFSGACDLTDLSILLSNFGLPAAAGDLLLGNLNADSSIGLTDLSLLLSNFGTTSVNCPACP